MVSHRFARTFFNASTASAAAALLNMLTTVLIARWLGNHVYADYIIDLAVISLILIILEIIPSNYVVFKVQDDPCWINSAATQAVISILLVSIVTVGIDAFISPFNQYTPWVSVYAALTPIKRFLDIRQQSTGNIAKFLKLEAFIAGLRLVLLFACVQSELDPATSVWMSLALATAIVQLSWILTHPADLRPFKHCIAATSLKTILADRSIYPGYYFGIILKRIRDNLMPLVAERFLLQKDELAAFFLAYRGLAFANSQIRILEAILSHRPSMNAMLGQPVSRKLLIASVAQIAAIIASTTILLMADSGQVNPMTVFLVSLIAWPSTYLVLMRAHAYSQYKAGIVNASLIGYVGVLTTLCATLMLVGFTSGVAFSLVLLAAESVGLLILYMRDRRTR